jgi:hypothetical protein
MLRTGGIAGVLVLVLVFAPALPGAAAAPADSTGAPDPPVEPRWWGHDARDATVAFPSIAEPVESWVYEEVERQAALGNLTGLHVFSRPLPRSLIAARVAAALAEGKRSVGLDRLARELGWEGRMMGLRFGHDETRPWVTLGPLGSQAKFNGLITLGGDFEKDEEPVIGRRSVVGFRGNYWHPPGLSLNGEYLVSELENARRFGDPVFSDTDIQFHTPRYTFDWHGRFWEFWLGRDDNRWGPGRSGGLLVGGGSDPYTQFGYRVHLGTFVTASAVHGWLSQGERRFVAFHRVEIAPGKGWRFGIGEGVRYASTAPEPLYLVNLVPYAAVERLQTQDGEFDASLTDSLFTARRDSLYRSNYMAAVDVSWSWARGWTGYGEILVDDVKPDQSGPTRMAYQLGLLRVIEGPRRLTLRLEGTRVYNYTYRVYYGRDFFHQDRSLGYPPGADLVDAHLWADLDLDLDWTLTGHLSGTWRGEGNGRGPWCYEYQEANNPYDTDCQTFGEASGRRLSGVIERRIGLTVGAVFAPRDNLRFEAAAGVARIENADHVQDEDATRPLASVRASWRW